MSPRTCSLDVIRESPPARGSPRVADVCHDFGIPPVALPVPIAEALSIQLAPGRIVAVVGPSGSGKSSLLANLAEQCPGAICVDRLRLPGDRAVVDAVAPRAPLPRALQILTLCGLGEPRLWLRRARDLSDGERCRAVLARGVGRALAAADPPLIVCDEFTTALHRRLARAVAFNLRRLATRTGLTVVIATVHDDILADLQPDLLVRLGDGPPRPVAQPPAPRAFGLLRTACIEPGAVRDYAAFAAMHYRGPDGLGFVDRVFVLRERPGDALLGVAVFAMAAIELSLRNAATDGRFIRNPHRLNRELRVLRRLVIHPDVRGCGVGHWFVRRTLPRVGTRFVECLAAMGEINPVFERAGLTRIVRIPLSRGRRALLERMRRLKLNPFSVSFADVIRRLPRVRRLVQDTIRDWAEGAVGGGCRLADRPPAQLARTFRRLVGSPPVYYLWDRDGEFPRHDPQRRPDRARPAPPDADDRRPIDRRPRDARAPRRHDPTTRSGFDPGDSP